MTNVQIVQPVFDLPDDEREAALRDFWQAVDEDPMAVILVEVISESMSLEGFEGSVFSTSQLALEHARASCGAAAVIIPKRLDEPTWGMRAVH